MPKFSAWVKRHLHLRKRPKNALPVLPLARRPITPDSFATAACLLFELPWDIRNIILSIAFGGRTLHIDLERDKETCQWRGLVCSQYDSGSELPSRPKAWSTPRVWQDNCLQRNRHRDYIGMMGFLLSCRQAYAEGIEFLYSANSVIIQSETLLLNLPQLIPTKRLASITSLQIVITAHWIEHRNEIPPPSLDHMKPILDNISTHCLALRSFTLAFLGTSDRLRYESHILHSPALHLLDSFYRSTRPRAMVVEFPSEPLKQLKTWEPLEHPREAPAKKWHMREMWRCLDDQDKPTVQDRSHERFPFPPLRLPVRDDDGGGGREVSEGYWLRQGDEEPMRQWYITCS